MKLVTVKVISEMLMVSPSTVYQWAETSSIPYYKINGALRFSEQEVLEWIKNCKKEPRRVKWAIPDQQPRKGR